eukprot:4327999-Amphidinium_carterae.1
MGEKVLEHSLLEILWTTVKDLRSLSDEWLYFTRVRDLPYEHPDYSLKHLARWIRVDNVQRHRSEIQASFRSRGLALPAGVIDDGGADAELNTVPNDIGGVEHDALDLLDDDLYAVPGFTGRPMPKSPTRKGQQKASRLKSPRNSESPREKPQKRKTLASFGQVREHVGLARNLSFPMTHPPL